MPDEVETVLKHLKSAADKLFEQTPDAGILSFLINFHFFLY